MKKIKICMFVFTFAFLFLGWSTPVNAASSWPAFDDINQGHFFIRQSSDGVTYLYTASSMSLYDSSTKGEVARISTSRNPMKYVLEGGKWVYKDSSYSAWSISLLGNGPSGSTKKYVYYSDVFDMANLRDVYDKACVAYGKEYMDATGNLDNITFYQPLLTPMQAETLLGAPTRINLQIIVGSTICLVALGACLMVLSKRLRPFLG